MMSDSGGRLSLHAIHAQTPLRSWSEVLDQAHEEGLQCDDAVWSLETVPVSEVDSLSAYFDSPDPDSEATINRLVAAFHGNNLVPPLLLVHAPGMPAERGNYFLWDGMHR